MNDLLFVGMIIVLWMDYFERTCEIGKFTKIMNMVPKIIGWLSIIGGMIAVIGEKLIK